MTIQRYFKRMIAFLMAIALLGVTLHPMLSWAQADQLTPVLSLTWKPDGSRLAVTTRDRLQIYDQNLQLVQELALEGRTASTVDWSPDGTKLVVGRQILDAETLAVLLTIDTEVNLGGWNRDGSQVWTLAPDSMGIAIFDAESGNLVNTISVDGTLITGAEWSPDSTRFATLFHALDTLVILDVSSGEISATYPQAVAPGPLEWSPDNTRIAGSTQVVVEVGTPGSVPAANNALLFEVYVWDAATGQVLNRFSGLPEYPQHLQWHPDGVELAGGASNGAVFIWDTSTNQQVDYFLSSAPVTNMQYSPFGGRLAVGSNPAQLQNISPERRIPPDTTAFVQRPADIALELFVPTPSIHDVEYIIEACDVPSDVEQSLTTDLQANDLNAFIAEVEALPEGTSPPACAADLIAVAEALQRQ
jgi:WD40 repeat protein